jgi:ferrochelatase
MFSTGSDSIGILLINVGTPEAPNGPALRRYLAQFLSDQRVIDYPRWLWLPLLHGIILNVRPRRSAKLYRNIWTDQGSPLLVIMRNQAQKLEAFMNKVSKASITVDIGLSYGHPSIAEGLRRLRQQGCDRILLFPLYPQYSSTTTAAGLDAAMSELKEWVKLPSLRWIDSYYHHPGYNGSLAQSIRDHWNENGRPDRLLFSFHGIPERYQREGDPYPLQCEKTAEEAADRLGLEAGQWQLAYQSRFGPEAWLQPYTDEVLEGWANQGVASVQVVAPGFSADCLETLDEIDREYRHLFEAMSEGSFSYIPALNDRADHIRALADIAISALAGWLNPSNSSGFIPKRKQDAP